MESILGNNERASALFEEAISLYEKEKSKLGLANTKKSIGDLKRENGNFAGALALYTQAIEFYKGEQEPMGLAHTYAECVRCYHALDREQEKRHSAVRADFKTYPSPLGQGCRADGKTMKNR